MGISNVLEPQKWTFVVVEDSVPDYISIVAATYRVNSEINDKRVYADAMFDGKSRHYCFLTDIVLVIKNDEDLVKEGEVSSDILIEMCQKAEKPFVKYHVIDKANKMQDFY